MSSILFLCDGARSSRRPSRRNHDKIIELTSHGRNANLRFALWDITGAILRDVSAVSIDLIRVASYVYAGDQTVSRGGTGDVYGHHWTRDLHFVIPVANPRFWSKEEVRGQLSETLSFLTGDNYTFDFTESEPSQRQLAMGTDGSIPYQAANSVMLFSGGADSLGAVVDGVVNYGKRPVLVSHRSTPSLDARQSHLAAELRRRYPVWNFPHISVWVNLRGSEAKDFTQRSRSFLYCSLGAVVASHTGINEVAIADNGVVSINIPKNAQLVGTYASRTTHPKFLTRVQDLFSMLFAGDLSVVNPLQFKTRAEAMQILTQNSCPDLLQDAISCAHSRQPAITPHCGVCSQCVDRRFGSIAAGMEEHDIVERYGVDIFTQEISEGADRTLVESYLRFAYEIENLTDDDIFQEYPELVDCVIPGDRKVESTAKLWISLLRRHSGQVSQVMRNKIRDYAVSLFTASLPDSCLIRLVTSGSHIRDQRSQFAARIANRLRQGIPRTFQSREPKNEHDIQDATDAILSAAKEDLSRELPLLPFGGISTKPDFANFDPELFYIEVKYLKTRNRLNSIVTEVSSRVTAYKKQGAFALFVVYDPDHCIIEEEKFIKDLTDTACCLIEIIR